MPTIIASSRFPNKPKLLDQVRDVIRRKHYSIRTEQAYLDWIKRFIIYHNKRHPAEMAEEEVARFLTHLARDRDVAPSTQNQTRKSLPRPRGLAHVPRRRIISDALRLRAALSK